MKNIFLKYILPVLLLYTFSILSIIASYPKVYSPYSLPTVIVAFTVSELRLAHHFAYLLPGLLYSIIYFALNTEKIFDKVNHIYKYFYFLVMLLGLLFNAVGFYYGLQYQGTLHTILVVGFNVINITVYTVLIFKYDAHSKRNSFFMAAFLAWMAYSAFPWLGELI